MSTMKKRPQAWYGSVNFGDDGIAPVMFPSISLEYNEGDITASLVVKSMDGYKDANSKVDLGVVNLRAFAALLMAAAEHIEGRPSDHVACLSADAAGDHH